MSQNPVPGYIHTVSMGDNNLVSYTQPLSTNLDDMPDSITANLHLKVNNDGTALILDAADTFNSGLYQELTDVNWSTRTPQYVLTVNNAGDAIVYQEIPGTQPPPQPQNPHIYNNQPSIGISANLDLQISPPGAPSISGTITYSSPPAQLDFFDFVFLANGFRPLIAGNYNINSIFNYQQFQFSDTTGNTFTSELILFDIFLNQQVAETIITTNTNSIPVFPNRDNTSLQLNTNVFLNNNGPDDRYRFIIKLTAVTTLTSYSYKIIAQNLKCNVDLAPSVGLELLLRDLSATSIQVVSPSIAYTYFPASVVNPIINNGFTLTNPITIGVDTAALYHVQIINNFNNSMISTNDIGQISIGVFLFDASMNVVLSQSVQIPVSEIPLNPSFSTGSFDIETDIELPIGNYTVQVLCNIFQAGVWTYRYTNELFEVHFTLGSLVNPNSFLALQDVQLGGSYVGKNDIILTINQDNSGIEIFPSSIQGLEINPAFNLNVLKMSNDPSYADVAKFFYIDENDHFQILLRPRTRFSFATNVPANGDILYFGHQAFQVWDVVNAIRTFNGAGEGAIINISDNFPFINQTTDARGPESSSRIIADGFPSQVWQATYIPGSDGRVANSAFPAFLNIQLLDFQIPTKNYLNGSFINRSVYTNIEVEITVSAYIMVPEGSSSTSEPMFIQTGFTQNRIVAPATTPSVIDTFTDTTSQQMPWYWFGANLGKIYKTWRIFMKAEDIIIPIIQYYPVSSSTQVVTLVSYQLDIIEV